MTSGRVESYLALDTLRDQIIAEWVKIFGIFLGIGLAPLLLDLPEIPGWLAWSERWFWLLGLAAGVLTIFTGVFYAVRQAVVLRRRQAEADPRLVIKKGELPPRDVLVQTQATNLLPYRSRAEINLLLDYLRLGRAYPQVLTTASLGWLQHALAQPEMGLTPEALEDILSRGVGRRLGAGERQPVERPTLAQFLRAIIQDDHTSLGSDSKRRLVLLGEFFGSLSDRLQEPGWKAGEALSWMVSRLDYLPALEKNYQPDKIARQKSQSVSAFIEQVAALQIPALELPERVEAGLAHEAPAAGRQPDPAAQERAGETAQTYLYAPTMLIAIGIFILLPALVGLLVQNGGLENPDLIQWYFSSPVILLWVAAEGVVLYPLWQVVPKEDWQLFGLLKSLLQIAAAFVLWNYLGSFFGLEGIAWLFWLAAVLAAAGALLGSLAVWLRRSTVERRSTGEQGEAGERGEAGGEGNAAARQPQGAAFGTAAPAPAGEGRLPRQSLPGGGRAGEQAAPGGIPGPAPSAAAASGARFQVFRGKDEQFYFRLLDGQGAIFLASEGYKTLASCINGILSVKKNAALNERFRRRTALDGERYFVLTAGNRRVVGTSETFASEGELEADIRKVQQLAPQAGVEHLA